MQPTNLAEISKLLVKQQQEKRAAEISDMQIKLVTVAYDKAAAYTTVIVFGGYAGFFAIWQLAKDHLSKEQTLWSALLVLISLACFVLFEVIKMALVTRSLFKRASTLRDPSVQGDPERLVVALRALDETQQAGAKGFMVFWSITVAVALTGALSGAAILGYAFIVGLAK